MRGVLLPARRPLLEQLDEVAKKLDDLRTKSAHLAFDLSSSEYQKWYDYGVLPERLHEAESLKLRRQYVSDELSLLEFEEALDRMFGIHAHR